MYRLTTIASILLAFISATALAGPNIFQNTSQRTMTSSQTPLVALTCEGKNAAVPSYVKSGYDSYNPDVYCCNSQLERWICLKRSAEAMTVVCKLYLSNYLLARTAIASCNEAMPPPVDCGEDDPNPSDPNSVQSLLSKLDNRIRDIQDENNAVVAALNSLDALNGTCPGQ